MTKSKEAVLPSSVVSEESENIDITRPDLFPPEMIQRHIRRYEWARDIIRRRFGCANKVLDFACGTGYGSDILSSCAFNVLGRDRRPESIAIASERYGKKNAALDFRVKDASEVRRHQTDDFVPFDAIVCIETLEHLDRAPALDLLRNFFDLIRPGGLLILSTPRGCDVLRGKWHKFEWGVEELNEELRHLNFADVYIDLRYEPSFIYLTARRPA